jgi:DNA polymerase I-like protein with 3'-5' exonuclease and polymerase domains
MKNTIVFDYETDNTSYIHPKLVGYSYQINDEAIQYVSASNIDVIKPYLESKEYIKVAHNLLFEYGYSKALGVTVSPPYFCTQIACLLSGMGVEHFNSLTKKTEYSYGLKSLSEKYLGYFNLQTYKDLAKQYQISTPSGILLKNGKPKMIKRMALSSDIPVEVLSSYCKKDVEMTNKLFNLTYPKLHDILVLWKVFTLEMQLIPVYCKMIRKGIKINIAYLKEQAARLDYDIKLLEEKMSVYEL